MAVEPRSPAALLEWAASRGLRASGVAPAPGGLVATGPAAPGDILVLIPDALAVTTADVTSHPLVASLAEGRGELVGLALWLLAERLAGPQSAWCVPARTPQCSARVVGSDCVVAHAHALAR